MSGRYTIPVQYIYYLELLIKTHKLHLLGPRYYQSFLQIFKAPKISIVCLKPIPTTSYEFGDFKGMTMEHM